MAVSDTILFVLVFVCLLADWEGQGRQANGREVKAKVGWLVGWLHVIACEVKAGCV